jgi:hypothetical protein
MEDISHKIIKIVIGEVAGAFLFIIMLLVVGALPNDEISSQISKTIIGLWAVYGIGTPIVILAELEDAIAGVFRRIR